jgi:hypothetical protein
MARTLIWTGAIAMVAGLIVFVVFVGEATHCSSENLAEIKRCQNATSGLHVGFGVLALGPFLIVGGAMASVRRTARARRG